MKVKITFELEAPEGTTHYYGNHPDFIRWVKETNAEGDDGWKYWWEWRRPDRDEGGFWDEPRIDPKKWILLHQGKEPPRFLVKVISG